MLVELRRAFPGWDEIASLERITIIDQVPAATIKGVGTGRVVVVAETTKGPVNKTIKVGDVSEIVSLFGDIDKTITTDLEATPDTLGAAPTKGWEGNLWWAVMNKRFAELCITRADTAIRENTNKEKVSFALARTAVSTTATEASVGDEDVTLKVTDRTGFEKVMFNGSLVDVSAEHPIEITIAGTAAYVVGVEATTDLTGTLTLSAPATWLISAAVVRVLDAYTLPGGALVTGKNDDGTAIVAAMTDDVSFAKGVLTATIYLRPVSDLICNKAIGGATYHGFTDVETETIDGRICPKTTLVLSGDSAMPYPPGMTMGPDSVTTASLFTCDTWANIVNDAYTAAIGNLDNLGGSFASAGDAASRNVLVSARHWAGGTSLNECNFIRTAMKKHADDSEATGVFVVCPIRPPIGCDKETALKAASTDPSVVTYRSDRILYAYPHFMMKLSPFSSEEIAVGADVWLASVLSQLAAEESPAQYHHLMDGRGITGLGQLKSLSTSTAARDLTFQDYKDFKNSGVIAPMFSADHGYTFYSAITSTLESGREYIARRRFADFVNGTVARYIEQHKSATPKTKRIDAIRTSLTTFFSELKSENNPDAQRIDNFMLDITSKNTATTRAKKIFVVAWKVKMLPEMGSFALFSEIGDTVEIAE